MCVVMRYTTSQSQKLLLDVMTVSMNALHRWARPHRTYTMNLARAAVRCASWAAWAVPR